MREVIREQKAFNGNTIRIECSLYDLGNKYKVKYKKADEYGFRFAASFGTLGEACQYFDKMVSGGR